MKQDNATQTDHSPAPPDEASNLALCPYCGHENAADAAQCAQCRGLFEPLSRQASQNAMGPWFVRDPQRPFQPGMSFSTLRNLIARNRITRRTILRGPTTRQFWAYAEDTPGVATLLGVCHACHAKVRPDEFLCRACNSSLSPQTDRQHLGLAPVRLLPGQGTPEEIAQAWTSSAKTTEKQAQNQPSPPTITPARPSTPAPITTVTSSNTSAPAGDTPDQQSALRRARRQTSTMQRWLGISLAINGLLIIALLLSFVVARNTAPSGAVNNGPATSDDPLTDPARPLDSDTSPALSPDTTSPDESAARDRLERARRLLSDPD